MKDESLDNTFPLPLIPKPVPGPLYPFKFGKESKIKAFYHKRIFQISTQKLEVRKHPEVKEQKQGCV